MTRWAGRHILAGMGKVLLCLLVLWMMGCAVERHEPQAKSREPKAPPTLKVSTELSPALQAAVVGAAADWQAAGFELRLEAADGLYANLRAGSCTELAPEGKVAPACARPRDRVILDLEVLEACRWVRVDGLTQCLWLEPTDVLRHELGHWLGLGYHLPDGNVMQAHYDAAGRYPKVLTELDVEATRAAHAAGEVITDD